MARSFADMLMDGEELEGVGGVEVISASEVGPRAPDFGRFRQFLGRAYLSLLGWKVNSIMPDEPKGIIIAAPHTSSWDLSIMLAVSYVLRVRLQFIARHTLFRGWGRTLYAFGGIPVDRTRRRNAVQQMIDKFNETDRLLIVIAPEGRLRRSDYWKSGFYHIAVGADVPIGLGYLDYDKKEGGVGAVFRPTGDIKADMTFIRRFYEGVTPKFPEKFGPIKVRAEDDDDS